MADSTCAVVWFRRDLRLGDNPAWAAATAEHDDVVALYVLDTRLVQAAGPFRRRQMLANLHALDATLRERGGRLLVRRGDAAEAVHREVERAGAHAVYANADVTPYATMRDDAVEAALDAAGVPINWSWGGLVQPPGAVVTTKGELSRVFTPFHRAWEKTRLDPWPQPGKARIATNAGTAMPTPDRDPPHAPGEDAALDRLDAWLDAVDRYPDTHDLPGVKGTSELSADLRFGTISPRTVLAAVGHATTGRAAFIRQLAWRDWYAHMTMAHPDIAERPVQDGFGAIRWRRDDAGFEAWKAGRTGFPIVDAGMRQLAQTGWMHNRVRMITASFLVKDLLIDWRRGERWFRHLLVDGDVPQNAGNWQWVAGTGPDAAPYFRIFNPTTQSRKFDPAGHYIRTWVPELAHLDDRQIHEPAGALADYPPPILDHKDARERALAAYGRARR
jgi:deoxyribodipyrimidine photo-lyase